MATIQVFREQVQVHAAVSIYSHFDTGSGQRVAREAISGYTEEVLTPIRRVRQTLTVNSEEIFRVDPNRVVDSLQWGEKAFQLRVWAIEEDTTSDAKAITITAGVEIQVHRRIAFPDEEFLYTSDEMLDSMTTLLDQSAWVALTSFDSFADGDTPSIDEKPERTGDVLSYTVAFSATVAAD